MSWLKADWSNQGPNSLPEHPVPDSEILRLQSHGSHAFPTHAPCTRRKQHYYVVGRVLQKTPGFPCR